jgi:hypothetical protein
VSNQPEVFFRDYVRRAYAEWLANPLDEYLAKIAVQHANIMAERVWHHFMAEHPDRLLGAAGKGQVGKYRDLLAIHECADFALIRDVAEGFKHVELNRLNARVSRFDQTKVGKMGFGEGGFGEGVFEGSQLIVTLDNGSKRALSAVLGNVIVMWERLLKSWGY